jgi:hypothetical protein
MPHKLKAMAVVAVGAAVSALALPGAAAQAATQVCGYYCVTLAAQSLGSGEVIDVSGNGAVLMAPWFNPGEDFVGMPMGTVAQLAQSGQIPSSLAATYGQEIVYQLIYAPAGALTGNCLGIASLAPGAGLKLQFCGAPNNGLPTPEANGQKSALWIGIHADHNGDFQPFINVAASTTGTNGALALTAGTAGGPLTIQNLSSPNGSVASDQMWETLIGIYGQQQPWPTPNGPGPN